MSQQSTAPVNEGLSVIERIFLVLLLVVIAALGIFHNSLWWWLFGIVALFGGIADDGGLGEELP